MSLAIGIGLKQVNRASKSVSNEKFMFQTSILLEDILHILKSSKELEMIKTSSPNDARELFFIFLKQASFIAFESSGMKISIEMNSARSKFNINSLKNTPNGVFKSNEALYFERYMTWKKVEEEYTDILLDAKGGIKVDFIYKSDLFTYKPHLVRDSISSLAHLQEINKFYLNSSHNVRIKDIDAENLFDFSNDDDYKIDLNYATKETFEFMLFCDEERAEELAQLTGETSNINDILEGNEIGNFQDFKSLFETSYYEPYIDVTVKFIENKNKAIIRFQYDIEDKKGSNFVYEI